MRWKGARRSQNVEDRRTAGGGKRAAVGGVGGIIVALIAVFVLKQDPKDVLSKLAESGGAGGGGGAPRELSAAEKELGDFVTVVLGYTEDVWSEIYPRAAQAMARDRRFRAMTGQYQQPKLVLFSGQVDSACGRAGASTGPFYCPGDLQVYIDLSFYEQLRKDFDAPGDFAQAYVIAHEVGHHVQKLLGVSDYVHEQRRRLSEIENNRLSVRLELQADYFAGVWASRAQQKFKFLEAGDLKEALAAASAIGDDNIQKKSRGYVVPDSFTHGSAEQRTRWFTLGLKSGDPVAHSPFDVAFEEL